MRISLKEIADAVDGRLNGDPDMMIDGVSPFETAGPYQITLAGTPKFLKRISDTRARAVIVPMKCEAGEKPLVRVKNPQVAFARVVELFHPHRVPEGFTSPHAHIGEDFVAGEAVTVSHGVVIGDRVSLGDRVRLHPGVVIGDAVTIGSDVEVYPNVTIRDKCRIGNRVIIHAGTVIGSDGFGFAPDGERYYKIPHTGIVRIDDDVEIGALNAIDRATFGETRIQKGVKTDNLVHIAHNVTVGENTVLVAQVGISGSTSIGRHAILAGQVGVSGHLNIGNNVTIGPQAGIAKSIPDDSIMSGSPEMPHSQWLRVQTVVPRLPEMKKQIAELEKRLKALEEK